MRSAVARGKLTNEQADAALSRVTFVVDASALYDTDVVIEAVPERLDVKIAVLRELDRQCGERTILASNSSGFPIAALAACPTFSRCLSLLMNRHSRGLHTMRTSKLVGVAADSQAWRLTPRHAE